MPKPRKQPMRVRIYDILEGKALSLSGMQTASLCCSPQGPYGSTYSFLLTVVILVNIASFMLSTEPSMAEHQPLSGPHVIADTAYVAWNLSFL